MYNAFITCFIHNMLFLVFFFSIIVILIMEWWQNWGISFMESIQILRTYRQLWNNYGQQNRPEENGSSSSRSAILVNNSSSGFLPGLFCSCSLSAPSFTFWYHLYMQDMQGACWPNSSCNIKNVSLGEWPSLASPMILSFFFHFNKRALYTFSNLLKIISFPCFIAKTLILLR